MTLSEHSLFRDASERESNSDARTRSSNRVHVRKQAANAAGGQFAIIDRIKKTTKGPVSAAGAASSSCRSSCSGSSGSLRASPEKEGAKKT